MSLDAQPPIEPPPPGLRGVAREGLTLYRSINKLDKWSGGGLGLSTVVKIAGWAGLIAVMAALVVKLRTVEQQLDPVSHSVAQLQQELEASRDAVKSQSAASEQALRDLGQSATVLEHDVHQASAAQSRARATLDGANEKAKELDARLDAASQQAQELGTQAGANLSALAQRASDAQTHLASSADQAQTTLGQVQTDLASVQQKAHALDQALAPEAATQAIAKVQSDAEDLDAALRTAAQHARELDAAISARLADEKARRAREADQPSSTSR